MIPANFTRPHFRVEARPLVCKIGDVDLVADPKEFSTGSLGFRGTMRTKMLIGGVLVDVQLSAQVTVVNSKDMP